VRDNNVNGTYDVFVASCQAGVKRIVLASRGTVIVGYEMTNHYDALVEGWCDQLPVKWRVLTYEDSLGPSILNAPRKLRGEALAAPESVRFDEFFVTSRNKYGYCDISHASALLGYSAQDGVVCMRATPTGWAKV
jgi:hypothetical protein